MSQQIILPLIIFIFYILFCIGIFYLVHHYLNSLISRKILHLLTYGCWIIYLSFIDLGFSIYILAICCCVITNIGVLFLSIQQKRLDIIVYGLILLFCVIDKEHSFENTIRLSILCFADGMAPVVAMIFHKINCRISHYNNKTIFGSLTVFVITLTILLLGNFSLANSFFIAILVTYIEYICIYDNLAIFLLLLFLI